MDLTPDQKLAGILAPLFALRGANDLGIGDVGALRELAVWSAQNGFRVVQLLPINETGNDNSPYNAISSVALDPPTIEITPEALPDLSAEDIAERTEGIDLDMLRAGAVAYPLVKGLKLRLLERAFENFLEHTVKRNIKRARTFRAFCREQAIWLDAYALFRTLMEVNKGTERWDVWLPHQQSYSAAQAWLETLPAAGRRRLEERVRFFKYVQWIAWEQWRALRDECEALGVALMGDIPFGVSYFSADVWASPELFNHSWCGGAPPEKIFAADPFTVKWGQNWGIPLYDWDVHRAQNFSWWRQRVAKVREIFHLFRIDHILGFFRIYSFPWRPEFNADFLPLTEDEAKVRTGGELPHFTPHEDDTDEHKLANRNAGEEFLRVLIEECGDFRLIGEDLGQVPDYVRPCLDELGIAGFKIPFWENDPDGSMMPGEKYARLGVAAYATHDFEPLRMTWESWMARIAEAEHGGEAAHAARDQAWHDARRLGAFCGFEVPKIRDYEEVHEPLLRALFATNSWIAIIMVTDLFASLQRFNVPGAVSEANWSERMPQPIATWDRDEMISAKMERVRPMLRETARW